ncbi:MAG: hypothetical protein HZA01_04030 [Nitrospinae bacterium]|nr:hypothetical protein [Nitrospinota bacterium]
MPNIFKNFFLASEVHETPLTGSYDLVLVLLSYLVASFASFSALEISSRFIIQKPGKRIMDIWLTAGAFDMGSGIWAMHFIGMMAFRLPMPMAYDRMITMFSWLVAVFFAGAAFSLLKKKGTTTALWIMAEFSQKMDRQYLALKACCALAMGLVVCGVHYTGMAAVFFPLSPESAALEAMKNATQKGPPFHLLLRIIKCLDLKIILLSSATRPLSIKSKELGISASLMKPVKQSELFENILMR